MNGIGEKIGAVVLLVALASGCAAVRGGDDEQQASRETDVTVEVVNQNWQDMHVYVLASGQRRSLGMVTSQNSELFELPRSALAADRDIVFIADPIGSVVAFVSDPVLVQPGDQVRWTIQNRLRHSSVFVR